MIDITGVIMTDDTVKQPRGSISIAAGMAPNGPASPGHAHRPSLFGGSPLLPSHRMSGQDSPPMVAAAEASALSMVPSPISPTAGSGAGFMNLTRSAATAGVAAVDRRPSVFETSASPVNRRPSVMPAPLNRAASGCGDDDAGPSGGLAGAVHHVRKASMQPAAMGLAAIGEMEVSVNAHTYSAAEAGSSSDGAAPASIEQQLAALLDLKLPAVPTLATWLSTPGQGLGYSVSAPLAPADVSAVEGDKNRQLWLTAVEAEKVIAWGMCSACMPSACT